MPLNTVRQGRMPNSLHIVFWIVLALLCACAAVFSFLMTAKNSRKYAGHISGEQEHPGELNDYSINPQDDEVCA